jgi:hypothetical protein
MRNISFTETKPQFRARQKHRTRRGNKNGPTWKSLKPGDVLMGCEQCQGLGKGGKIVRMGPIVILETNFEPLDDIIRRPMRTINPCSLQPVWWSDETTMEGFPELTPAQFVDMFCAMNDCEPETEINNILFDYVDVKP